MKAVRGNVRGIVQGVGFRYFTQRTAENLDLDGWVKNIYDGSVEFFVQGDDSPVDKFIKRIKAGPSFGRVDHVYLNTEAEERGLIGFDIRD